MAVNIEVVVFWFMTPCCDVVGYQHLGGPCCLHEDGMVVSLFGHCLSSKIMESISVVD
jgi:hypothetical protein